jgi:hypothetical protein
MDQMTAHQDLSTMREGDDFVCRYCGCEVTLKRHGDPERMPDMRPFTCCCGTVMELERQPERQRA